MVNSRSRETMDISVILSIYISTDLMHMYNIISIIDIMHLFHYFDNIGPIEAENWNLYLHVVTSWSSDVRKFVASFQ